MLYDIRPNRATDWGVEETAVGPQDVTAHLPDPLTFEAALEHPSNKSQRLCFPFEAVAHNYTSAHTHYLPLPRSQHAGCFLNASLALKLRQHLVALASPRICKSQLF